MELSFLTEANRKLWDQFALSSDDAWFSHTSAWLDWAQEINHSHFVGNFSFFIKENNELLAIAPLIIEKTPRGNAFSFFNAPAPFPALKNNLSAEKIQKILAFYVETVAQLAQQNDVVSGTFKIPSLSQGPQTNSLCRFGYSELPYKTQIIHLNQDLESLWSQVRKDHKASIKKTTPMCSVYFWTADTITQEKMDAYRDLHYKDAGRVTRSQRTFDMMHDWIKNNHAVLVEARLNDQTISFAVHITYKKGAYYGSSCKDPDHMDIMASHFIQWESIRWLKEQRYDFYDVGLQWFGPQWFEVPNEKEISISSFKRGFGGQLSDLITAEYFFDKKVMEEVFQERLKKYFETFSARTSA